MSEQERSVLKVVQKWGFGMSRPKSETQRSRFEACARLIDLIASSELPPPRQDNLQAVSIVKGLFNRIVREDQWDWFTVAMQLGYPPWQISEVIANELHLLRIAIRDENAPAFDACRARLLRLPTCLCLSVFLGRARIKDEPGAGWVYVLSTRQFNEFLKIGMTTRNVEQRVQEINRATGVPIPYGVRRCWRVSDPVKAEKLVHRTLAEFRIREDREFFKVSFPVAVKMLDKAIKACGLEVKTLNALIV